MASRIFALLVGINDYDPKVGRLYGCVGDVERYEDYLRSNFSKDQLQLEVLTDRQATTSNIVDGFERHLAQARANDVVLFQYSGHGARSKSNKAFRDFYPGGWDEGLVCYDSRRGGKGNDLADKELAVLLANVAKNDPHIVVLLDCCHSGSGTRQADDFSGLRSRHTHTQHAERAIDSYSDGFYANQLARTKRLEIPGSKHILLAACTQFQQAYETRARSGVFTSTLMDELERAADTSYADLFVRVRASIRRTSFNQNPQFETFGGFNAYTKFLGSQVARKQPRFSIFFESNRWKIECGAINGIPTAPEKKVEFAVYEQNNSDRQLARAIPNKLGLSQSAIQFCDDFQPRYDQVLEGELTSMPLPPLLVAISGDDAGIKALEEFKNQDASLAHIHLVKNSNRGLNYSLCAGDEHFRLKSLSPDKMLYGVKTNHPNAAKYIFSRLKHIARWEHQLALRNHSNTVDPDKFEFKFVEIDENGNEIDDYPRQDISLDIVERHGQLQPVIGRLKAKNCSNQNLNFLLVHFSDRFGVRVISNQVQEPSDSFFTFALGKNQKSTFKLRMNDDSELETTDHFMLVVSEEKVDDFVIGATEPAGFGEDIDLRSARAIDLDDDDDFEKHHQVDWLTTVLRIKSIRKSQLINKEKVVELAGGIIKMKPHRKFSAAVGTLLAKWLGRSAGGGDDFYKGLEQQNIELVNFSSTRGQPWSVLELSNIQNESSLKDEPLEIEVNLGLKENEQLLAATFDGEFIQLVGDSFTDQNGSTRIRIDEIPTVNTNRRSVIKALKLYFFKTFLDVENVNRLRGVEYADDGQFKRTTKDLQQKVAAANNILLLIHGIIGDTKGIAAGVNQADVLDGQSIRSRFDLVLTYDYENLNTPIEENARQLKKDLEDLGIDEADEKQLTILAHSMGGLVSRWFIEKEGSDRVVDHLVMCGTPNQGSPFGFVDPARKIFGSLTMLAMNMFPAMVTFGVAALAALNRTRKITVALEQMKPGSPFLTSLNDGTQPSLPYSVLAGDVQEYDASSDELLSRIIARFGSGILMDQIFGNESHDIAVNVESIFGVGDGETSSAKFSVACHHLNYFSSDEGLQQLAQVRW